MLLDEQHIHVLNVTTLHIDWFFKIEVNSLFLSLLTILDYLLLFYFVCLI